MPDACAINRATDDRGQSILLNLFAAVEPGRAVEATSALLTEFGSLARTLAAGMAAQARVIGDQPQLLRCLDLVRRAMLHALETDLAAAPVMTDMAAVVGYLRVAMAHEPREHVRVLFLDAANRLIRDEVVTSGTVGSAELYPREIVRRALELGATALILAHNHPSGDATPSKDDIRGTRSMVDAARTLDISVHDHLIVARGGFSSMRALGLM